MSVPYTDIRVDYMDTPVRRVLDLRTAGLPEVPLLGWYHYTNARPDLPVHRHHEVLEICYMERGSQYFQLDSRSYQLRGGEVLVVPPGVAHSTAGRPSEPGILYWLNLIPSAAEEWAPLISAITHSPHLHFHGNTTIKALFDHLLAGYDARTNALRTLRLHHYFHALLLEMIDQSSAAVESPQCCLLKRVVQWIETKPYEVFNLEELAQDSGLSLSQFKTRFKGQTGCSPREFIIRTRIQAACQTLTRTKRSISQIAVELNFPTTQYFATVFRKYKGITPTEYRHNALVPVVPSYRDADNQY